MLKIGNKIKYLREKRAMTMKQLAVLVNISESMVSQIEHNKVMPSVENLYKISKILDVDMNYFFTKKSKSIEIVSSENRKIVLEKNIKFEKLSSFSDIVDNPLLESYLITIPLNSSKGDDSVGHKGVEFGYVLQGRAKFIYGEKVFELQEGDSITFEAGIKHKIENIDNKEFKAIWVNTPPKDNL